MEDPLLNDEDTEELPLPDSFVPITPLNVSSIIIQYVANLY